jgi:hypothetical protein
VVEEIFKDGVWSKGLGKLELMNTWENYIDHKSGSEHKFGVVVAYD